MSEVGTNKAAMCVYIVQGQVQPKIRCKDLEAKLDYM